MTEAEWIAFFRRPEIPAFNARILEHPDADLPRLVFADWVEENCPHTPFVMALRRSIANPEVPEWVPNFSMVIKGHELRLWRGRLEVGVDYSDRDFDGNLDAFVWAAWKSGWVGRLKARSMGGDPLDHLTLPTPYEGIEWLDLFDAQTSQVDVWLAVNSWHLVSLTGIDLRFNTLADTAAQRIAAIPELAKLRELRMPSQLTQRARLALANSNFLSEHIRAQFRRPT